MSIKRLMDLVRVGGQEGLSLMELIVIIAIIGVLAAMSAPTFKEMRQSLQYRQAAQEVVSALRYAQSRAVMTNRQHQVQFDVANRSFDVHRGNLAIASNDWATVVRAAETFPDGVFLNVSTAGSTAVTFNPTGSAAPETIRVRDSANVTKYRVKVAATGRVWREK